MSPTEDRFYLTECFYFYQVRIFTFSVGQHNYDKGPIQWMACSNKGASGPLYTPTNTHAHTLHTHTHTSTLTVSFFSVLKSALILLL